MLQTWQHTGNHGKDVCIKLLFIIYIQSEIVEVFLPLVLLTQYVLSEENIRSRGEDVWIFFTNGSPIFVCWSFHTRLIGQNQWNCYKRIPLGRC